MGRISSELGGGAESSEPLCCNQRKPGVLVVDDEPGVLHLLQAGLRQVGFDVYLASNGLEAVSLYRRCHQAIGVVLLDVLMPGLDGPQTLSALQAINPGVRACFMSGSMGPYKPHDLLGRGAWRVFSKPFNLKELALALRQFVDGADSSASPGRVQEEGPPNDS
jgi:CheY-like chemotaxis protein